MRKLFLLATLAVLTVACTERDQDENDLKIKQNAKKSQITNLSKAEVENDGQDPKDITLQDVKKFFARKSVKKLLLQH